MHAIIGRGRTADILEWDEGRVLKVYKDWCRKEWIEAELTATQAAHNAGLPVPQMYGTQEYEGHVGILMERIAGESMAARIMRKPWLVVGMSRSFAQLVIGVHNLKAPRGLPDQRADLERSITRAAQHGLPAGLQEQVLQLLDKLPDGNDLCHGDLHPNNILLTKKGPVIIDWMTARCGDGLGDLARSSLIMGAGRKPSGTFRERITTVFIGLLARQAIKILLARYCALKPFDDRQFEKWCTVCAAERMAEQIPGETLFLLKTIRQGLKTV